MQFIQRFRNLLRKSPPVSFLGRVRSAIGQKAQKARRVRLSPDMWRGLNQELERFERYVVPTSDGLGFMFDGAEIREDPRLFGETIEVDG